MSPEWRFSGSACAVGKQWKLQAAIESDDRIRPFGVTSIALQIIAREQPREDDGDACSLGVLEGSVHAWCGGAGLLPGFEIVNLTARSVVDLSQSSTCCV